MLFFTLKGLVGWIQLTEHGFEVVRYSGTTSMELLFGIQERERETNGPANS